MPTTKHAGNEWLINNAHAPSQKCDFYIHIVTTGCARRWWKVRTPKPRQWKTCGLETSARMGRKQRLGWKASNKVDLFAVWARRVCEGQDSNEKSVSKSEKVYIYALLHTDKVILLPPEYGHGLWTNLDQANKLCWRLRMPSNSVSWVWQHHCMQIAPHLSEHSAFGVATSNRRTQMEWHGKRGRWEKCYFARRVTSLCGGVCECSLVLHHCPPLHNSWGSALCITC